MPTLSTSDQTTSSRFNVTIQSDPAQIAAVRKTVEEIAQTAGLDDQGVAEVGLCVNEALANVIRHAYGGVNDRPIVVSAYCQEEGLVVTIRDWGCGVNPASLPPKPYDPLEPGGLGLICLWRMMSQVSYVPQGDGMLLEMKKHKQTPTAGTKSGARP